MGPRVQVSPEEFVDIANAEGGLVIKRRTPFQWQANTYVVRSGDYYYYTITKQALMLSGSCRIREAKNVLL